MSSPTPTARAPTRLRLALLAVLVVLLGAPALVDAQVVQGVQNGAREGNKAARDLIAAAKIVVPSMAARVIDRAIQIHGALGYSTDLPLEAMYRYARAARLYDGPDEVHRVTVARQLLKGYQPVDVPTEHVPTRRAAAQEKFAALLEQATADL